MINIIAGDQVRAGIYSIDEHPENSSKITGHIKDADLTQYVAGTNDVGLVKSDIVFIADLKTTDSMELILSVDTKKMSIELVKMKPLHSGVIPANR